MFEIVIFLTLFSVAASSITQHHFEFENALTSQQIQDGELYRQRSQASNGQTVYMKYPNIFININLCIVPISNHDKANLTIDNILFSNDGGVDTVTAGIDDKSIGQFASKFHSDFGHYWNVFEDSGPVGNGTLLQEGNYTLKISAVISSYGIELDNIRINIDNFDYGKNLFCGPNSVTRVINQ